MTPDAGDTAVSGSRSKRGRDQLRRSRIKIPWRRGIPPGLVIGPQRRTGRRDSNWIVKEKGQDRLPPDAQQVIAPTESSASDADWPRYARLSETRPFLD